MGSGLSVAIVGGGGRLPLLAVHELLHHADCILYLDLTESSTPPYLKELGLDQAWKVHHYPLNPWNLRLGLRLMKRFRVQEVFFLGGLPHQTLLNFSWTALWHLLRQPTLCRLWRSLPDTRTDTVLAALAGYITRCGFPVVSPLRYLRRYLLPSRAALVGDDDPDLFLGIVAALALGSVDVGQSVVVRRGSVLAVEAIEGTDACLERAIALGSQGAILVKMGKPRQDLRFDLPTIGEGTFQRLKEGGFRALAIDASVTLCVDKEGAKTLADHGITLITINDELKARATAWHQRQTVH